MYKSDKIVAVTSYDTLLNVKVDDFEIKPYEVRLKLHPSGTSIQWIECGCKKNRTQNLYCSHIIATLIYLDQSEKKYFKFLDDKNPIKVSLPTKRSLMAKIKSEKGNTDSETATQNIVQQLHGDVVKYELINNGPSIRVFFEIKTGQISTYDFELDAAADFLKKQKNLPTHLRVHSKTAYFSKVLKEKKNGLHLEVVKCVAIKSSSLKHYKATDLHFKKNAKAKPNFDKYITITDIGKISYGQRYVYVPKEGYFPVFKAPDKEWLTPPASKILKDDKVAYYVLHQVEAELSTFSLLSKSVSIFKNQSVKPKMQKLKLKSGTKGWLALDPTYTAGESTISLVELVQKYKKSKQKFLKTGDQWLEIPDYINEFDWEFDEENNLKLDYLNAHRLRVTLGEYDHDTGSVSALEDLLGKNLITEKTPAPCLKEETNLDLRDYQTEGYEWLWWLYSNRLHGLLADDMGLGKTHQAMSIMSAVKKHKKNDAKFLVIAPTTVLNHWQNKIHEFAPDLKPLMYYGNNRLDFLDAFKNESRAVITSYGVILRDIAELSKIPLDAVILDEAHYIKNKNTATYGAVCKLKTDFRVCMSGTPIENNLSELKNLFDFLLPGYLGSDEFFNRHYLSSITKNDESEEENKLIQLIHPFKLRRTKDTVLDDLPAKVEDKQYCDLSPEQVRLYQEALELRAKNLIQDLQSESGKVDYIHIFAVLNLLKQICDHPWLVDSSGDYTKHESGKFELYKEILNQAIGSGHKVVVYSQYLKMIDILSDYATKHDIQHVKLTGATKNRGKVIEEFQENPECKLYLGSLLAGGIGVDLTAASVVIHYDRWWNPSKENQATDRVHRIGQVKNVQVIKLITKGTMEEKIDQLIEQKKSLYDRFLNKDEDLFKKLSREDVLNLLK